MVYTTNCETISLNPEHLLFEEDSFHIPHLAPLVDGLGHDSLDWLVGHGATGIAELDDQLEMDKFDSPFDFGESLFDNQEDSPFEIEHVYDSNSSSPSNDFTFSNENSDEEEDTPKYAKMAKRSSKSSSITTDESDNEFKVKKTKGKKGAVTKASSKPTRRVQDDATLKAISQLRNESGDHPDSRRRIHNVLERKRRNDLKYCYQELRESIPDLESTERTPTGTILARAAEYIRLLQEEDKKNETALVAARLENEILRRQLGIYN